MSSSTVQGKEQCTQLVTEAEFEFFAQGAVDAPVLQWSCWDACMSATIEGPEIGLTRPGHPFCAEVHDWSSDACGEAPSRRSWDQANLDLTASLVNRGFRSILSLSRNSLQPCPSEPITYRVRAELDPDRVSAIYLLRRAIAQMPEDYAPAPSESAVSSAIDLSAHLPVAHMFPNSRGGVNLEWGDKSFRAVLTLRQGDPVYLTYSTSEGTGQRRYDFIGPAEIDEITAELNRLLASK